MSRSIEDIKDALMSATAPIEERQEQPEEPVDEQVVDEVEAQEDAPQEAEAESEETIDEFIEANSWDSIVEALGPDVYDWEMEVAGLGDAREKVKIGDLKNRYQDYVRDRDKLAKEREQLESEKREALSRLQGLPSSDEMMKIQGYMQRLQDDYDRVDKNEDLDPGEKANIKLQLGQAYQQAQAQLTQAQESAKQAQMQQYQDTIKKRDEVLMNHITGWKDPKSIEADMSVMTEYIAQFGGSREDIANSPDPRFVELVRDAAMRWRDAQAASKVTEKVRKAPKLVKAGARQPKQDSKIIKQVIKRAKSPGATKQDQLAALRAIGDASGKI